MGATATFLVVDALANKGEATQSAQGALGVKPKGTATPSVGTPPATDGNKTNNDAMLAAERRRRLYANVGRSSTILTQGQSLGQVGTSSSEPKMLLGL